MEPPAAHIGVNDVTVMPVNNTHYSAVVIGIGGKNWTIMETRTTICCQMNVNLQGFVDQFLSVLSYI